MNLTEAIKFASRKYSICLIAAWLLVEGHVTGWQFAAVSVAVVLSIGAVDAVKAWRGVPAKGE